MIKGVKLHRKIVVLHYLASGLALALAASYSSGEKRDEILPGPGPGKIYEIRYERHRGTEAQTRRENFPKMKLIPSQPHWV